MKKDKIIEGFFILLIISWILFIIISSCMIAYKETNIEKQCHQEFGEDYFLEFVRHLDKYNCCTYEETTEDGYYETKKVCYGLDLIGVENDERRN